MTMEKNIIEIEELKSWFNEKKDFLLVDVMNPEYFAEKHIRGAVNAPVYEVVFLTYLEKLSIPKSKTIVVYGEKEDSLAAHDAKMKLEKDGYMDVYVFANGLYQWEKAGYPIEKGESVVPMEIVDGEYQIDAGKSIVGWIGRNAKYAHRGRINVKAGNISISGKKVVSGEIEMDMATITDDDLTDSAMKGILEHHLKSSDFFDVENYPQASFRFESAEEIAGALIGTPNYSIKGSMTIKEISNPISFMAMIAPIESDVIEGQAHFDFDRTLWNVRYGSEKFFEKLGMHLVNDNITLEIFLVAKKK